MAAAPQPTVGILPEEADLHTAEARVNKHKADWRGWKFMWPFAVVFVFVFIIPIVYAIYISFFKKQMVVTFVLCIFLVAVGTGFAFTLFSL